MERNVKMKKSVYLVIAISVLISILCLGAIQASAFFGLGAQVIAENVSMIKTGLIGQKISFTFAGS